MKFEGTEAIRLADAIEAAASADIYAAAPPALGLTVQRIGGATALLAPALPATYFNRVIGLGIEQAASEAGLDAVIELYRRAGAGNFWIHLGPGARPAALGDWLRARGFGPAPRRSWAKFLRRTGAAPKPETAFEIGAARVDEAAAVGAILCAAYGMPAAIGPWYAGLVGRPRWRVFVARTNGRPIATGSVFSDGDHAWLGAGATLAEFRQHGAQSALLAARLRAAAEAGCTVAATETGEPTGDEPNPSLANIQRAGFVQVCSRLNFAAT